MEKYSLKPLVKINRAEAERQLEEILAASNTLARNLCRLWMSLPGIWPTLFTICAATMPKAVLDSSVLVSAFIAPQTELMQLLRLPLRRRYELVLSKDILTETAESLLTKESIRHYASYTDEDVHGYLAWLLSVATLVDEVPELSVVPNDPKDNMVIATAVAGKADYLVTGDRRHLLPMKEYQGIFILSPRSFLDLLESEQGAKAA